MKPFISTLIVLVVFCGFRNAVQAQELLDTDAKYRTADTNNAVIEGRVSLPSGFAAERYVKITVRNTQVTLFNRYTSTHGEFRFDNLSEGVYFLTAELEGFEPVEQKIALGRGITSEVNLQLHNRKSEFAYNSSRVVSIAELRQAVPVAARKEYELGLKLVNKNDFQNAATHFQNAVSLYPEYLAARNDLGAQYLKLKRIDEAEAAFQMVIEKDPKNFNAKFNLGLVRVERKNYLEAIAQLNQAIVIDSTRPVARLWLGVAYLESADLASAERELMKALVMGGPECIAAHYHLARIYFSRGDISEATRSVQAYLEDAPRDGEYVKDAKELEKKLKQTARQ
jgi:tetratricopeptide (TPR) repeat protein